MNIFKTFHAHVCGILLDLQREGVLGGINIATFTVNPTERIEHGILTTNAALAYSKAAIEPQSARGFAQIIIDRLDLPFIDTADVAGHGFINIRVKPALLGEIALQAASGNPLSLNRLTVPDVNIEYVSANPTGPMHVGHARGAVVGDVIANLLAFVGRSVIDVIFARHAGKQIDTLAHSAFIRYQEALGEVVTYPKDFYPGDYLLPVAASLKDTYGGSLLCLGYAGWKDTIADICIRAMMDLVRGDLDALGIRFDIFFPESRLVRKDAEGLSPADRVIEHLRGRDLVYEGTLEPPLGDPDPDWSAKIMTLFRSSSFGDDCDRVVLRDDLTHTYFANDLAYHEDKITRGYKTLINVWGADHGGYVKRMQSTVSALSQGRIDLEVVLCQMVSLKGDIGQKLVMGKRSGNYVTLRALVDAVGRDAVRFLMLMHKADAPMEFNLEQAIATSKDNPVFYVQYGHARTCSVLSRARSVFPDLDAPGTVAFDRLTDEDELELMRTLIEFPRMIEKAALNREPHRIAYYLYRLASQLHGYWQRGSRAPRLLIVDPEDQSLTQARVALVGAVGLALRTGLLILGVAAPERMDRVSEDEPDPLTA